MFPEKGVKGGDGRNVFFGYAKTLGRGGMFISSVNPRGVDDKFNIAFRVPDNGEEAKCLSRVVWRREYDPKTSFEAGMALEFLDMDEKTRDRIDRWVKKNGE